MHWITRVEFSKASTQAAKPDCLAGGSAKVLKVIKIFGKTKAYAVYMPSVRTDMKAATASLD